MTFEPDVVFCDLGMGPVDGFDVARELKVDRGSAIYLVALTGWGTDRDRCKTAAAGFDLHVVKPVDERTLQSILGNYCGSRAAS